MSTAFIMTWAQFTDSGTGISGVTPKNYGGSTDWLKYWFANTAGGADLTTFDLNLRTAPASNYKARVAETRLNDLPLLEQDLSSIQLPDYLLYPGTQRNKAAVAPPTISWNGYAWVSTVNTAYSSTPVASFGGASVPHS